MCSNTYYFSHSHCYFTSHCTTVFLFFLRTLSYLIIGCNWMQVSLSSSNFSKYTLLSPVSCGIDVGQFTIHKTLMRVAAYGYFSVHLPITSWCSIIGNQRIKQGCTLDYFQLIDLLLTLLSPCFLCSLLNSLSTLWHIQYSPPHQAHFLFAFIP